MFYCLKQGQHAKNSITDKIALLVTTSFSLRYFCLNDYGMYPFTYLSVFSSTAVNLNSSEDVSFTGRHCIVFLSFTKYSKYLSMIYGHSILECLSLIP